MSFLESVFGRKRSVIGVDIGTSSVKIVQLRKEKGTILLETYGSLALGPYVQSDVGRYVRADSSTLQNVIQVLMKEAKITSRNAGVAIPFRSSLLSLIDIPNVSETRIPSIIPYEARKYIPVPIEDVSLDWFLVPSAFLEPDNTDPFEPISEEKKKTKKVLLIAVYNKNLLQYKEVTKALDFNVDFFEIEVFSALRAILETNKYPVLLIDIGCSTTKFYIVEYGLIIRSYFINQGGETMTNIIRDTLHISFKEAEAYKRKYGLTGPDEEVGKAVQLVLGEIMSEADRTIKTFEGQYKKTVSKVLFMGGGTLLKGFNVYVRKIFNIHIVLVDPFSRVKHPVFLGESLRSSGRTFSIALGAALRMLK